MATNTKTVEIEVKAKDNASKTLDNVAKKSSSMADKIKENLWKIRVASGVATAWLVALWKSFVDASIENEPLQKSFERLSESAWIASDEMLKAMRNASRWTVADTNLMAQANKAYALWIVNSAEDMATMIEIARLKGQAMWRTMEEALWDITTGLWRWSAQILDNLWIVVNAEEVNEKYAESIWKTVKELTEAEKKQALVNAVVAQWRKELEEAGEVPLTMAEKMQVLNATWSNTQNVIGDALVPVLDKLLQKITPIITKVAEWIEKNPELTANLVLIATGLAWLVFACSTVIPAITSVISVFSWLATFITWTLWPAFSGLVAILTGPIWLVVAIGAVVGALYWLQENTLTTQEQIALYEQELENLRVAYENWEITLEQYITRTNELNQKIQEAEAKHRTLWGYLKDSFIWTLKSIFHPLDENNGWLTAWIKLLTMLKDWLVEVSNTIKNTFISVVNEAVEALQRLWNMMKKVGVNVGESISNAWTSTKNRVAWKLSWFANGWSVSWNVPIVVGEQGPEVFVPKTAWNIVPNNELWWSINVNINFWGVAINSGTDEVQLAQMISDTITRNLELYQKGIY